MLKDLTIFPFLMSMLHSTITDFCHEVNIVRLTQVPFSPLLSRLTYFEKNHVQVPWSDKLVDPACAKHPLFFYTWLYEMITTNISSLVTSHERYGVPFHGTLDLFTNTIKNIYAHVRILYNKSHFSQWHFRIPISYLWIKTFTYEVFFAFKIFAFSV